MNTRSKPARQQGLALVEFLVVTPVFLFLMMATAELGFAFQQYSTLTKAVREGARYISGVALDGGTTIVDLQTFDINRTRRIVVYGNAIGSGQPVLSGFAVGDVSVTDDLDGYVTVSATYNHAGILGSAIQSVGNIQGGGSLNFTMRAAVKMRAL